jgi:hypothetical protein
MKKYRSVIIILFLVPAIALAVSYLHKKPVANTNQPAIKAENTQINSGVGNSPIDQSATNSAAVVQEDSEIPLKNTAERITKKPFGIFITPASSPVQPERFSGYHTGTDFEIYSGEENIDVEARAICDGKIIYKNSVNGYGGVIIQRCNIDNKNITVLYGHISLTKSIAQLGVIYKRGDAIAILGKGYSTETDGERKHLHLGIYRGGSIELKGYVGDKNQLAGWIDFQSL